MIGLIRKISSHLYVPLGWTLITVILLCLPGSAIPKVGIGWLGNVDKIIHFILFGFIPVLWTYYILSGPRREHWVMMLILLAAASTALGIVLEYVQFYLIPNRDFDILDIIADSAGAVICSLIVYFIEARRQNIKKPL